MKSCNFAVIGGDMRQLKLAELLAKDGKKVQTFAIDHAQPEGVIKETLEAATAQANCVILPLPISRDGQHLNTPLSNTVLTIEETLSAMNPTQIICGGQLDTATLAKASSLGLTLLDYYAREEFVIANAVATAEGAIQAAMEATPMMLSGTRALVFGFGRIGKVLAHRLQGLGVRVSVTAGSHADLAWITAYGYQGIAMQELDLHLAEPHMLFNTIPKLVLDAKHLRLVDSHALLIDLSSKPGGIDHAAAEALGLKCIWALGLPGKVAPLSAASILHDTIYNILSEQEKHLC